MLWCATELLVPVVATVLSLSGGWAEAVPIVQADSCTVADIVIEKMPVDRHPGYAGWATWAPGQPCQIEIRYISIRVINHELGHCILQLEGHPTTGVMSGDSMTPSPEELQLAYRLWHPDTIWQKETP